MVLSKSLAAVLLTTTAVAASVAALETAAQRQAEATLARALAQHPNVRVASIGANLFERSVDLRGIQARRGRVAVEIGALHLPAASTFPAFIESAAASPFDDEPAKPAPDAAPAPPAAPPAAAPVAPPPAPTVSAPGKASADNITILAGDTTYRIKHVELGGTTLSDADLTALLDAKSSAPVVDRLKKLNAASIVIPEIAADTIKTDVETHWSEHDILLANVVAGRVETGSAAGMSLASKTPKGVVNGTIGAIQAKGLDLAQIVRVFSTQRTDDAEPLVPLVDSVSINGLHISDLTQKTETSLGPVEESGLKGRPLKTSLDQTTSKDTEASKAATRDLFQSLSLDSMSASDLKVAMEQDHQTLTLASLSMQQWGSGKVGAAKFSSLAFSGPDTTFSVGGFELTRLEIPLVDEKPLTKDAKDAPVPSLARTDVTDVALDTTTKASKPDAAPTHVKFTLKHAGFSADPASDDGARQGAFALDQLVFDLPPDSAGTPLAEMGYSRINTSGGFETRYDKGAQTATIKNFTVSGADMGAIHLSLDLANVSPALFSQDTNASKVAALALLVKSADLRIQNTGLVDRALAWRAKADKITPQQEQTQLADLAAAQIPAALGNGTAGKAIGAAVARFIAQPKTLHLAAKSKTGLGLADAALLSTPDVLLDAMEITASANE